MTDTKFTGQLDFSYNLQDILYHYHRTVRLYIIYTHSSGQTSASQDSQIQIGTPERIKYKTACMFYNTITGSGLFVFLSCYTFTVLNSRSFRSSLDTRRLKFQRPNRKTRGFHTFSHFGPHINWNNLPQDINQALSSFKSRLKTFVFSEYQVSVM